MKTCLPVLIVLIAASASTGVWAQEWRPIDASRTVHFTAAGLEKTTPFYTARQDTVHFAWREFSPWRGASGVRAEILHSQLAPGWVFTTVEKVLDEGDVKFWNFFKDKTIAIGRSGREANGYGSVDFSHFALAGANCVIFRQVFAERSEDLRNRKTDLLSGYYCAAAGRGLSEEDARSILRAYEIHAPN